MIPFNDPFPNKNPDRSGMISRSELNSFAKMLELPARFLARLQSRLHSPLNNTITGKAGDSARASLSVAHRRASILVRFEPLH
jgi:hypothetical protein